MVDVYKSQTHKPKNIKSPWSGRLEIAAANPFVCILGGRV